MNDNEPKKTNKQLKKAPETTGHMWDGISEYNIPAPRWWLIVWIICIIWSVGYWFFYPTWPTKSGNSKGSLNWSQQSQLLESQKEIENRKNIYLEKFAKSNFEQIMKDPDLTEFALNGGRIAFKENCAACHGTGAQGAQGYPNLNDDDWLWGGKIDDIYQTIKFGIRSEHEKTRFNQMPSFGIDKILSKKEIESVADYVISLSDKSIKSSEGAEIFKANCSSCHGADGKGNQLMGAPNLADAIWLYGKDKSDVIFTITYARNGVMPYWKDRLDDNTIKELSVYIYSLGGGK